MTILVKGLVSTPYAQQDLDSQRLPGVVLAGGKNEKGIFCHHVRIRRKPIVYVSAAQQVLPRSVRAKRMFLLIHDVLQTPRCGTVLVFSHNSIFIPLSKDLQKRMRRR